MLTGKVCIVTEGSRGIGKAISQISTQIGAIVYIVDIREGFVEEWSKEFNKNTKCEVRSDNLCECTSHKTEISHA